jgi:hypothetical protein
MKTYPYEFVPATALTATPPVDIVVAVKEDIYPGLGTRKQFGWFTGCVVA